MMAQEQTPDLQPRALCWPGERHCAALAKLARQAMEQWHLTWLDGRHDVSLDVVCAPAHAGGEVQDWQPLVNAADADDGVWVSEPAGARQLLAALLGIVPSSASRALPALAAELAAQARGDYLLALKQALAGGRSEATQVAGYPRPMPAAHSRVWSGAVRMDISAGGSPVVQLHLGPRRVQALAPIAAKPAPVTAQPLADLGQALSSQRARLRVELSSVEITLGQMQALALGDVLLLPHLLEQPLRVFEDQGRQICAGYLGQQEGGKAIELVREPPSVDA
ncbi:FliM/FliN family flagellar motor switch protein [Herbaspirillum frisingense]|uniref:FliM/FliN family flagellar motor switch protein n=1 Tax=Herbaspirillum frisingense TaxID=92645 RepID=UPI001603C420|nr:FliM/FliN family flagellar motor C-terminal domain-containing protein [Herbaspirillum frisingense]QNB08829.1 FliM/FliN family flagellar motor switch protein [Herbaspirillum frisingense]